MQDKKKKEQSNEPKKNTAEDRAKKELEKIASYQARLAKKKNKPKKIKTVMDESNRDFSKKGTMSYYFVTSKGTVNSNTSHIFSGSLKRSKSSFAADLTDTSKKGVKKMRYE